MTVSTGSQDGIHVDGYHSDTHGEVYQISIVTCKEGDSSVTLHFPQDLAALKQGLADLVKGYRKKPKVFSGQQQTDISTRPLSPDEIRFLSDIVEIEVTQ